MTTLTAIVAGTSTDLSDGTLCWREMEAGVSMPPLHRISRRGPQQHGQTDVGFRLDPRLIHLKFGILGADEGDMLDKRAQLLAIFKPRNAALSLRWALANGQTRQIDCHYAGDFDGA